VFTTTKRRPPTSPPWYPDGWSNRPPHTTRTTTSSVPQHRWHRLSLTTPNSLRSRTKAHARPHCPRVSHSRRPHVRPSRSSSDASTSTSASSTLPQKSILHRSPSTLTTRTLKSAKSVKFADIPEICYDDCQSDYGDDSPRDDCKRKGRWRFNVKSFILDFGKKKAEAPSIRQLGISGPYRLCGSCPTLSHTQREKDARAFKPMQHAQVDRINVKSEPGWIRDKLEGIWKGVFCR
jgi:hypothetical protein